MHTLPGPALCWRARGCRCRAPQGQSPLPLGCLHKQRHRYSHGHVSDKEALGAHGDFGAAEGQEGEETWKRDRGAMGSNTLGCLSPLNIFEHYQH